MIEWSKRYNHKILDIDEVRKVENELGIKFPKEYVECIIVNDGASPEQSCIDVLGRERVFGLLKCSQIIHSFNVHRDTFPKNGKIVPFGNDPAGNLFCFDYRSDYKNPAIVFQLHEEAYSEEDFPEWKLKEIDIEKIKEQSLQYVCKNFLELLKKLRYPDGYENMLKPKLHLQEVINVSDKWKINFPYSYKKFAVFFSGEKIQVDIKVGETIKFLDRVLSYREDDYNIENSYNNIKDLIPLEVFPIIRDTKGDYVCLDYRKNREKPLVVFWSKDVGYKENSVQIISNTFNEFLELIKFDKILFK